MKFLRIIFFIGLGTQVIVSSHQDDDYQEKKSKKSSTIESPEYGLVPSLQKDRVLEKYFDACENGILELKKKLSQKSMRNASVIPLIDSLEEVSLGSDETDEDGSDGKNQDKAISNEKEEKQEFESLCRKASSLRVLREKALSKISQADLEEDRYTEIVNELSKMNATHHLLPNENVEKFKLFPTINRDLLEPAQDKEKIVEVEKELNDDSEAKEDIGYIRKGSLTIEIPKTISFKHSQGLVPTDLKGNNHIQFSGRKAGKGDNSQEEEFTLIAILSCRSSADNLASSAPLNDDEV